MMSIERPTRLRLAGFVLTALGGLLVGMGAVLAWAAVSVGGFSPIDTRGLDTMEGKIALVAALVMLISIPAMRAARPAAASRTLAVLIVLAGLSAAGVALRDAVGPESRLGGESAEEVAREIAAETGLPYEELRQRVENEPTNVDLRPGIFVVIAGGVLGAAGGALSIAWVRGSLRPAGRREASAPV
jgi:4-amino-4-deoxy-L-arabinose transferase-like glycosyltransferase